MQLLAYQNSNKWICVSELKLRIVDVEHSLQQNVIDTTIDKWRKQVRPFMHADGQHF